MRDAHLRQNINAWLLGAIVFFSLLFPLDILGDNIVDKPRAKQVMILNSYHQGYKWTDDEVQGAVASLKKYSGRLEIHLEYMDAKRILPEPRYLNQLEDLYRVKYKDFPPDLIVCTDNDALDFMVARHKALFAGVPIVFCGVNGFKDEMLQGDRLITGIAENPDVVGTVHLARALNPRLERVVVISDESPSGQRDIALVRKAAQTLKGEITFDFTCSGKDKTLREVEDYVAQLPRTTTVALYVNFFRDRSGIYITPDIAASRICQASVVPVYVLTDVYLGFGSIGGDMILAKVHGQIAGQMGKRILQGESISRIPVLSDGPTSNIFDYRLLQRFGFRKADLPPDSMIVYKPVTFYSENKRLIWTTLSIILILSFLILILTVNIFRRRQAEQALMESEAMLRSMFDAAPAGTALTVDRVFKKVNNWFWRMTGYSGEELTDQSTRIAYPDDAEYERVGRELYGQVQKEGFGMVESRLKRKDGKMINVLITSNPIDPTNWTKGQTTMVLDITDLKHAQEALKLDEMRLETLLKLNQMREASLDEISTFAMEEAVRLTQSKIGYIAFTNEDETVLAMHAWSKSAMAECNIPNKRFDYIVSETGLWGEAIRQRQPIITNDYPAQKLWKKGYPEGHIALTRHMNVPVFDGDKIVVVAGVANKETEYDQTDVRQLTLLMSGMWRILKQKQSEEQIRELNRSLEQRVRERTAELNEANKELEAFAYSTSHDLRAPLRSIAGFSQILMEEQNHQLSEEGKQLLERVRAAAYRMEQMIEALLHFSRMIRAPLRRSPIDLSKLCREIAAGLQESNPARQVEFVIAPDIVIQADPDLIQVVVENLLGNAWKYTRNHPTARIELGVQQEPEGPVYFIRDDGAGFNEAYAGKLFQAFQRLHRMEEFEGTGIGLATVARIIRRHGGRIWAHGALEKGATFYFTLS